MEVLGLPHQMLQKHYVGAYDWWVPLMPLQALLVL